MQSEDGSELVGEGDDGADLAAVHGEVKGGVSGVGVEGVEELAEVEEVDEV